MVSRSRLVCLVGLVLLLWAGSGHCIRVKNSFTTKYQFILFEQFGFKANGTINLTVGFSENDGATLHFLLCTHDEYTTLLRSYPTASSRCRVLAKSRMCFMNEPLVNASTYHLSSTIDDAGTYDFMLANCDTQQSTHFTLDYELLNPGGEQLGTGYIPLPAVYKFLVAAWAVVCAGWFANWFMHRKQRIGLHLVLTLIPSSKLLLSVYNAYYWQQFHVNGTLSGLEQILYYGLLLVFEGVFFTTLLLIAKGWCITRTTVAHLERRAIIVTVVSLVFSMLFYKLLGGYYLFALIIIVMIVLKFIFTSILQNMRVLHNQLDVVVRSALVVPSSTPVYAKFDMFRSFQTLMVTYVFVDTLVIFTVVFFLSDWEWLEILLQELLEVGIFVCMGWLFRLRDFKYRPRSLDAVHAGPVPKTLEEQRQCELDLHTLKKRRKSIVSQLGVDAHSSKASGRPICLTVAYPVPPGEDRTDDNQLTFATLQNVLQHHTS